MYHRPQSYTRVKSYDRLNFTKAFLFKFKRLDIWWVLIIHESKVMAIWIFLLLPFSISSISMYNAPELDIREKSYDRQNFLRASIVIFWVLRYIIGLNHTLESKVMAIWICLALSCLILNLLIYYGPESDIRVKSYGHLNLPRAFLFKFEGHDIWWTLIIHTSEKLWQFEFLVLTEG